MGACRVVRASTILAEVHPPEPVAWPRLSVVIPACNEADLLEDATRSILAQDYPDLEIILVDDRSTDGTGAVVDRLAAADPRVQPIHVTELPEGWLGKVHALKSGYARSSGDWILFTDADVHLAPGTLRRAVAWGQHRGLDHLAGMPDIWPKSFLLDSLTAVFLRTFLVFMRVWAVEDPRSRAAIGVGAFNLVRRAAFDETPGFEWLRLEVADDVGLGQMMKFTGARSAGVNGRGMIGLYWYRTIGEVARGAEKAYASVAGCSLGRAIVVCAMLLGFELAPFIAILPLGNPGLRWAGLGMMAAGLFSVLVIHRWAHRRILPGLLTPPAVFVGAAVLLRSGWLGYRRGGVVWRGTLYPSAPLRAGCRVRFP